ncbi:MAG: aminotransferase class V-fold PLP-dependent enzyme [Bacteroidetes bacterium]|nr:aminotransferase class V-fold PLP-dependent enzyme [Bacteroidota bacterium]
MNSRRSFLKQAIWFTGAIPFLEMTNPLFAKEFQKRAEKNLLLPPDAMSSDEDFWGWIKEQFTVSSQLLYLNNGGVSPQPKCVQDAHIKYYQMANEGPSYYMWRILDQGREALRAKLADLAGCSPEEIAINRNSTEALNTTIFGLNLKAGDEVVGTLQDYPNMINAWKQRQKREGIKYIQINLELPNDDDVAITKQYTNAFTDKTKVVHITHMINWNGNLMPAQLIADEAKKKAPKGQEIDVILDAAHSFGLFDFKVPDTNCDYMGTSLHKFLCAPFGSGMYYIRKEKIKDVWPLLASSVADDDIRKFETIGTRSFASEMAIGAAVDFHNVIGSKRKEERIRFLKNYWTEKVVKNPKVKIHTSTNPKHSCAIALFSIEGWKPEEIEQKLLDKYKIHCITINWENVHGVRVTPNVYTTPKDLDRLVKAVEEIAVSAPTEAKK